jgi:hypothetical protein
MGCTSEFFYSQWKIYDLANVAETRIDRCMSLITYLYNIKKICLIYSCLYIFSQIGERLNTSLVSNYYVSDLLLTSVLESVFILAPVAMVG